jgi:uncharacterized protein involved in outer membrane biogenesis
MTMKKLIKWVSIVVGILLVVLIVGAIALPFIIPLEKIKDFAVQRISEAINREVKIEKVAFNIFEGIKLEGLSISNRKGFAKKAFVSADAIVLRYAFWPLFRREVIISEISLVKPEILIEKNQKGEYNFSDLLKPRKTPAKEEKEPPFSLFINTFSLSKGRLTYSDYATKTTHVVKNINTSISGIVLGFIKPIDVKASAVATYKGKDIPASLSGNVGIDLAKEEIKIPSLSLSVAGERVSSSLAVSNWKKAPRVNFSINSSKLSIDPLLAIFAAPQAAKKEAPKRGALTKTINRAAAGVPRNLSLKGSINISNLTFQKLKADKVNLGVSLSNRKVSADIKELKIFEGSASGKAAIDLNVSGLGYNVSDLKLAGFNASPLSNYVVESFLTKLPDHKDLVDKAYGTLDASLSLSGRGVEVPDIMANASASGSLTLKNGELKRLKTMDAIADKIKTPALKQDIKVSKLSGNFAFKNQVLTLSNFYLLDQDVNVKFNGGLDLNRLEYVKGNRLTLKGAASITKDIPKEFDLFRDEKGWLELTFELRGSLKKPIPYPILEKVIEKEIGKLKLKIEAEKLELERKAKEELKKKEEEAKKAVEEEKRKAEEAAKKKLEEEKARLKKEAEEKLKEMIKF